VGGWIPREEVIRHLQQTALVILPSYSEGIPNILLEAMAAGAPILTTRVGGIPEILDETSATFVETGDTHDLAAKILACFQDERAMQAKALNAWERLEHCDISTIAGKWYHIVSSLSET
jgi:glycosyltransferase involved in cell wall biosynthesis